MRAGLLVLGIAVVACGAAGLLAASAAARNLSTGGPALLTAAATLLLAAATAVFAWRAARRSRDMAAELDRLARSVDAAIADLAARADREKAALAELQDRVSRELGTVARRPAPQAPAATQPPIVAGPPQPPMAAVPPQPPIAAVPPQPPAAVGPPPPSAAGAPPPPGPTRPPEQPVAQQPEDGVVSALHEFMKAGRAELSLQPIISVARGSARGYEVHVHVAAGPDQLHIGRLQRELPRHEAASFERLVVLSAADAARRRLVQASDSVPLHVAISSALLGDDKELAAVLDLFRSIPALAPSFILSLPSKAAAAEQPALQRLAATGVGLAVEGWDGTEAEFHALRRLGFRFLKLPADRLVDRADAGDAAPAIALLDMAAENGVQIVGTDVRSDEDAVALLDLGIDLMTGQRFSGPRRLTPEAGDHGRPASASNR